MTSAKIQSATADKATRRNTIVKGGSSEITTSTKKKEPPQSTDRMRSIAHSRAPMEALMEDVIVDPSITLTCCGLY